MNESLIKKCKTFLVENVSGNKMVTDSYFSQQSFAHLVFEAQVNADRNPDEMDAFGSHSIGGSDRE